MKIRPISFQGKPKNYATIDNNISRSAQPMKDDFIWLKEQGVTDIINFRTMVVSALDFDEKTVVENLGMKYHNIPSITARPNPQKINDFLNLTDDIINRAGKIHLHCKAGADRTGMYAYIYKSFKGIGDRWNNMVEMVRMGHNTRLYPNLLRQTNIFINNLLKAK